MARLPVDFYRQDVLTVAPALLGKYLCRKTGREPVQRQLITETEAYRGEEDLACHAKAGKTKRTSIMYESGGGLYVYLIYGMYWMLNVVTGRIDHPQAVLIRGTVDFKGPGILTRELSVDGSFNRENLSSSSRIWIEDSIKEIRYTTSPRIGIQYAGDYWKNVPWRYILSQTE